MCLNIFSCMHFVCIVIKSPRNERTHAHCFQRLAELLETQELCVRTVIFASSSGFLDVVERALDMLGVTHLRVAPYDSHHTRLVNIAAFNSKGALQWTKNTRIPGCQSLNAAYDTAGEAGRVRVRCMLVHARCVSEELAGLETDVVVRMDDDWCVARCTPDCICLFCTLKVVLGMTPQGRDGVRQCGAVHITRSAPWPIARHPGRVQADI